MLKDIELGDKYPFLFLHQMQNLAETNVGKELLKSLWLQRLSYQMQAILATSDIELLQLAVMED